MRLFLAIDLPSELKNNLEQELQPLKKEYPYLNWVSPENFHITLLFFDETDDKEKVIKTIDSAIYDITPFHLYSLNSGIFIDQKITLYSEFRREKKLEILVEKLKEAFYLTKRVEFVPHLTIARYKIPSKQQYLLLKKKLNNFNPDLEFEVDTLTLFESIPSGKRPIYKKITEFKLEK